jgi:hypothetical protein
VSRVPIALRRQRTRPPADADALAAVTVRDLDGRELRLGSVWEGGAALLVFLRHYG